MQGVSSFTRNSVTILVVSVMAFVLGYVYVQSFNVGWRAVVALHLGILFFLGCALFLRDLRSFFLFVMIFAVPLEYGYHLIFRKLVGVDTAPFAIGIRIDVVDVVLLLLYMHWGFVLAQTPLRRGRITIGNSLGKLFLLWIVWVSLAGILRSEHLNYTAFELVTLYKGFLLYFYLVNNLSSEQELRVVLYAFFAVTVAQGLYIIMQYVTGFNYSLHGETPADIAAGAQAYRAIGFTGWDGAAAIMNYILPIMLIYYFIIPEKFKRGGTLIGIGIVLLGLLFLKMRSAYFAGLVSIIIVLAVSYLRRWISARQVLGVLAAALVCLTVAVYFAVQRFESGETGVERIPLMLTALNIIKANWLLGVGANNYLFHIEQYLPVSLRHTWEYTVHNEYLLRAAETGIPGFLIYYALLLIMMRKLWKVARTSNPWIYMTALGLFASLVGSLPYRVVSFFHTGPLYYEFCVVLALTYFLQTLEKRRLAGESSRLGTIQGRGLPVATET